MSESYTGRGWRPSTGDTVAGEVIDISSTDGGYGPYHVLTLRGEDGAEVDVHAFHTVLRNELGRRNVQVGDRLEIAYLGHADGGRGKSGYDHYRVKGGKTPVIDWDSDAGAESAPEPDVPIEAPVLPGGGEDDGPLPF